MYRPSINPKISVSIVFVAAMFMSIMDSTIVNVALPSLSRQFNATGTSIDAVKSILRDRMRAARQPAFSSRQNLS